MKWLLGPFAILLLPCPLFGTNLDLWWSLCFRVLSEIMFTKRLFLSVGHPVFVLFGQRVLLLGKTVFFLSVPRALFQKEAWKAIATFQVRPGPVPLIGVDVPSWVNDPCPLLGHQKKGRTVTHYQSVGDLSAPVRLNWRQGWEIDSLLARFPLNETGLLP